MAGGLHATEIRLVDFGVVPAGSNDVIGNLEFLFSNRRLERLAGQISDEYPVFNVFPDHFPCSSRKRDIEFDPETGGLVRIG